MRTDWNGRRAVAAVAIWIGTAAAVQAQSCAGDCDGNGAVGINELVSAVNVALGVKEVGACLAADADRDGTVVISELVKAVASALGECAAATPTSEPSPTATATDTATNPVDTHTATPVPSATDTVTPEDTAAPTGTATQTRTATPVPTVTHTPMPTDTRTPTRTATATPTLTHTVTPTGSRTPTSTATPVPTLTRTVTPTYTSTPTPLPGAQVGGVCRRPGSDGLVACNPGTAVRAYRCDNRLSCVDSSSGRTKLGEAQVGAQGRFAMALNPALAPRNVLILEADVAAATVYRIASAGPAASGAGAAAGLGGTAGAMDEVELDPTAEAGTRIVSEAGLRNLPEEGLAEIDVAVEEANAEETFAGLTPAAAADLAEQNARANGGVTFAVQQNRSGRLCENTVWSASRSPFLVVRSVIVGGDLCPPGQQNVTLTIEPGVEIRFREGNLFLQVRSTLIARGQAGNEIRFTSDEQFPSAGDWSGIVFEDTTSDAALTATGTYAGSGSIIEHATIEYAEGASPRGALTLNSASPLIKHVRLQRNHTQINAPGVLRITGDSDVRVESVEIDQNVAGSGVSAGGAVELTVVDSRVSGNGTFYGIHSEEGLDSLRISGSRVEGVGNCGVRVVLANSEVTVSGSVFSNNSGCGAYLSGNSIVVSDSKFEDNKGEGMGFVASSIVIDDSEFSNNSSGISGFAYLFLISDSEFSSNTTHGVGIHGDGQFVQNSVRSNLGTGVSFQRQNTGLTIGGNLIVGNGTQAAGSSGVLTGNCLKGDGTGSLDLHNATVTNNTIIGDRVLSRSTSQWTGNNFLGTPFAIEAEPGISPPDIALPGNWWGFTDPDIISSLTLDCEEDSALRCVNFSPFATGPIAAAPDIEDCANGILTPGTP